MKRIIYIILVTFIITSCSDDYLDVKPYGKVIPETVDDLAMLMNNAWDLNEGSDSYLLMLDDALLPASVLGSLSADQNAMYFWQDEIYSSDKDDPCWESNYKAIAIANFVITNVDDYDDGEKYDRDITKGEAYFSRAISLANLLMFYSKEYNSSTASTDLGVPVPLNMDVHAKLPRSSVQDVYAQVYSDLAEAETYLPQMVENNYTPSLYAVYALKGRLYLMQKEYEKAEVELRKAIDMYSFLYDYNVDPLLANYSLEISNMENLYVKSETGAFRQLYASNDLVSLYDQTNDFRFADFIEEAPGVFSYTGLNINYFTGIRNNEVYLNYCEALMRQATADPTTARTYIETLRSKRYATASYMPLDAGLTDSELLNEIMLERRRELAFYFMRWFDMKRFGVSDSRTDLNGNTFTISSESNNYVLPIPAIIINQNDNIEQNPRGL